jgi:hypothetical protein
MKLPSPVKYFPLGCGLLSWLLILVYLTGPHPSLHLDYVLGRYKIAEKLSIISFLSACMGATVAFGCRLAQQETQAVVVCGFLSSVSAALMVLFGLPW